MSCDNSTDILATVYHALGIWPHTEIRSHLSQLLVFVKGKPITALFGPKLLMAETLEHLKQQLGTLAAPERAELARSLIRSLDEDDDPESEAAWEFVKLLTVPLSDLEVFLRWQ